ncbi:MAG: tetratricopeptide repeat protein [Cyanobacteria bacterium P01_C01_bin.89]
MSQNLDWLIHDDWDEERPSAEETYQALRRSVERTTGFGLKFVQCNPAAGADLRERLRQDLSGKLVQELVLDKSVHKLFDVISEKIAQDGTPDVLCVVGLEYSLVEDIKPGNGGGEGDYYSPGTTPRILAHLNQNREKFRDSLSFNSIFFLPKFAQKYFIRRAADFVDWGSGIFELSVDKFTIAQEARQAFLSGDLDKCLGMTPKQQREKRIELQCLIEECEEGITRHGLLLRLGGFLSIVNDWEGAIASYDKAIEFKPDDHEAWYKRGVALGNLGCAEEAIASYDKALEIKPDAPSAWYGKACCHGLQGKVDLAIKNLTRAIELSPDKYRKMAQTGIDFDPIRSDPRFQALLNPDISE